MKNIESLWNILKVFLILTILIFSFVFLSYDNLYMLIIPFLTLIVFSLSYLFEKFFNVKIPPVLDLTFCIFAFLSQFLGDVCNLYLLIPWWDDFLHFTSGVMIVEISYFFMDLIKNNNKKFFLTSLYKAIISFFFAISILTFWECFEFGCDNILGTDTQKDTIINRINSSEFTKNNKDKDKYLTINSIIINDNDWIEEYGGYIDIGLYDTMYDLLYGIIGTLIYSIIRYKYKKKTSTNR